MCMVFILILSVINIGIGAYLFTKCGEYFVEKKFIKGIIYVCGAVFLCFFIPFYCILLDYSTPSIEYPASKYELKKKFIDNNGQTDSVYVITKIKD